MKSGEMIQIGPTEGKHWLRDDETLWRYVPLRTLFFYLAGNIFLPSVRKLQASEPFEGESFSHEAWINDALHKAFGDEHEKTIAWIHGNLPKDAQDLIAVNKQVGHSEYAFEQYQKWYLDFITQTRFAWCWYRANKESAAMWSTYGAQGAAILSKVGRVRNTLENLGCHGAYRKMYYYIYIDGRAVNFNPETPEGSQLILRPYFLKRDEYESENEVRFVVPDTSKIWKMGDALLFENVKPEDWIDYIVLGPGLTQEQIAALKRAASPFIENKNIGFRACELHYGKKQEMQDRMNALDKMLPSGLDDGIPKILKQI